VLLLRGSEICVQFVSIMSYCTYFRRRLLLKKGREQQTRNNNIKEKVSLPFNSQDEKMLGCEWATILAMNAKPTNSNK
jgi:hypothetical protein